MLSWMFFDFLDVLWCLMGLFGIYHDICLIGWFVWVCSISGVDIKNIELQVSGGESDDAMSTDQKRIEKGLNMNTWSILILEFTHHNYLSPAEGLIPLLTTVRSVRSATKFPHPMGSPTHHAPRHGVVGTGKANPDLDAKNKNKNVVFCKQIPRKSMWNHRQLSVAAGTSSFWRPVG